MPYWITQCYLPPGSCKFPEAGTRFSHPGDARLSWPGTCGFKKCWVSRACALAQLTWLVALARLTQHFFKTTGPRMVVISLDTRNTVTYLRKNLNIKVNAIYRLIVLTNLLQSYVFPIFFTFSRSFYVLSRQLKVFCNLVVLLVCAFNACFTH